MNFWYVFTTAPNKERAAAQRLGEKGFLANVPLWNRVVRDPKTRRGNELRLVTVVPGYLFVWLESDWRLIKAVMDTEFSNGDKCTRGLVKFAGEPGKISDEVMREFLQFIREEPMATTVEQLPKVGDTIRVKNGPLASRLGTVGSVEGVKVSILTEMFKRSALAVVSIHNVELVTHPEKLQKAPAETCIVAQISPQDLDRKTVVKLAWLDWYRVARKSADQ